MNRANYRVIQDLVACLVIQDIGPWSKHLTITNDAENVVADLVKAGHLPEGRRLFYYDSNGNMDELVVKNGHFDGFAPRPIKKKRVPVAL